ncbi:LLM class flavin-dependent oxidoreductase (plasmid) [Paroceanicella profunda]|uniref:Luciferase-like monooxygenase n=1 Tax=Paroceanicella profunda TaxID=2579971 RepID=A0A5B8G1B6_9RHOB|nr:LLM class flavin-dependent oxidoreductase [Paroceanicella profunda]QDL93814.1 LLM class flavin-dependent oxidoreductase [Paroceanicella profunda]
MTRLSILDLAPVPDGSNAGAALRNSLDLARHAEAWGFHRFWMAEHHNMPGIASAATAVALAHVAAGTRTIRVGAGGIMLPNHAPLIIAEQFGTLAALHPGRVDLGLGRAPGTDQRTAMAMRRDLMAAAERFPDDVVELLGLFKPAEPGQPIRAVPGAGLDVDVWILGSSLFGAQLAALLGLPYAFASHFAPGALDDAVALYRERFQPSERLAKPYVMVACNVITAETEARAAELFTSQQQAFVNLRSGRPGLFPRPKADYLSTLAPSALRLLEHTLSCSFIGTPEQAKQKLDAFIARTGADEVIVSGPVHDHNARLRSFELLSDVAALPRAA